MTNMWRLLICIYTFINHWLTFWENVHNYQMLKAPNKAKKTPYSFLFAYQRVWNKALSLILLIKIQSTTLCSTDM